MARGQRRRHAARAADFVDDHLGTVWSYLVGMTGDVAWATDQARTTLGGVDPRLLEEQRAAARRLLIARARRAVEEAAPPAPAAPRGPAWLVAGLTDLDLESREAFVLLDAMGLSAGEAAAATGDTEADLRARRARAHAVLVSHLVGERP